MSFLSLLLLVPLVLLSLWLTLLFIGRPKTVPGLPQPKEWKPLFGCYFDLKKAIKSSQLLEWKLKMIEDCLEDAKQKKQEQLKQQHAKPDEIEKVKLPELMQWGLPFCPTFVEVLSPRNMKFLFHDQFESFVKGGLFRDIVDEFLGDGIFAVDGESWRTQRKSASHMFSFAKLHDYMFQTFTLESERALEYLHEKAKSGEEFDLQQLFFEFTFDSICKIAFGKEMHTLGSKTPHPFGVAFDTIQAIISVRGLTPGPIWKLKRFFQLGSEKEFTQYLKTIDEFVYGIVEDRKKNLSEYESDDLLTLFLRDAEKRSGGEPMTDRLLRDLILNFMVAGRDTTATGLTWLFHDLSTYPDVEAKCATEVTQQLTRGVQPTPEVIKSLTFLEASFMETIRLHPPVPSGMKLCIKDVTFPSGEFIPKGCQMRFASYNVHHLPSFYEGSTMLQHWAKDCTEYKPTRWLIKDDDTDSSRTKILNPPSSEFMTFITGPRLCLGKSMAILEAKTLASSILQQFIVKVRPGYQPRQRISPVFAMVEGLPCTIKLRI